MSIFNVPVSTPQGEAQILLMEQYARTKQKLQFILSVRSIVQSDGCRQHTANDVCQLKKKDGHSSL